MPKYIFREMMRSNARSLTEWTVDSEDMDIIDFKNIEYPYITNTQFSQAVLIELGDQLGRTEKVDSKQVSNDTAEPLANSSAANISGNITIVLNDSLVQIENLTNNSNNESSMDANNTTADSDTKLLEKRNETEIIEKIEKDLEKSNFSKVLDDTNVTQTVETILVKEDEEEQRNNFELTFFYIATHLLSAAEKRGIYDGFNVLKWGLRNPYLKKIKNVTIDVIMAIDNDELDPKAIVVNPPINVTFNQIRSYLVVRHETSLDPSEILKFEYKFPLQVTSLSFSINSFTFSPEYQFRECKDVKHSRAALVMSLFLLSVLVIAIVVCVVSFFAGNKKQKAAGRKGLSFIKYSQYMRVKREAD
eukprot:TRINITY_DN636_c0_g2_i18.p1 TRINITY_DN636_c0_g2~~TRINITY_DN636_c0_g2_i18.p1  ORF type:complete len:361 (-),score=40.72 TRINITY_DN636_c0_g2_i18:207-1289(-)